MKHIQLWANQEAYIAGKKYYPNVSLIVSGNTVVVNENPL